MSLDGQSRRHHRRLAHAGLAGGRQGIQLGPEGPWREWKRERKPERQSLQRAERRGSRGSDLPKTLHCCMQCWAAVALAEDNERWQEGIRTWSGRAVPSWAPVWHSCAAEAARQCGKGSGQEPPQCDCEACRALPWGSGLPGLQATAPNPALWPGAQNFPDVEAVLSTQLVSVDTFDSSRNAHLLTLHLSRCTHRFCMHAWT